MEFLRWLHIFKHSLNTPITTYLITKAEEIFTPTPVVCLI